MRKWLVPGIVAVGLVLGALGFLYRAVKQNQPAPFWVELRLQGSPDAARVKAAEKEFRERVSSEEVLLPVVRDLQLVKAWKVADESAAVARLKAKVFVKFDETGLLRVGVNGTRREAVQSKALAEGIGRSFIAVVQKPVPAPAPF